VEILSEKRNEVYMKEPLARLGELYAKLYYQLAKEMLSFGEKGERALRRAIRNYGKDRGETMRKQAEALMLPLTYETFRLKVKDFPTKEIMEECVKYFPGAKVSYGSGYLEFCELAEVWNRYPDGRKIGKIYCDEFHHAKWAAFNPKFKVDMIKEITNGDSYCKLISYIEGDEYDQKRQKTIKEICAKAKSYGFIIDTSQHGNIEEACKSE